MRSNVSLKKEQSSSCWLLYVELKCSHTNCSGSYGFRKSGLVLCLWYHCL